jgi:hypothetical protein
VRIRSISNNARYRRGGGERDLAVNRSGDSIDLVADDAATGLIWTNSPNGFFRQ